MIAQQKGHTDDDVMKILRKTPAPRDLQSLFYTPRLSLVELIDFVQD